MKAPERTVVDGKQPGRPKAAGASSLPAFLISFAAAGAAAYVWRDYPIYRENIVPALAGVLHTGRRTDV